MNILRSVSRRGFSVGTAGWFTVLKTNTWFPAASLPRKSPRSFIQPHETAETAKREPVSGGAGAQVRTARWLASEWSAEERSRARTASAILGALAITSAMLWWIMHP